MARNKTPLENLTVALDNVSDFRIDRKKLYPLSEILFLVLSAVVSGCTEWEEIEDFGEIKQDWLKKFYPYENGIPSTIPTIELCPCWIIEILKNILFGGLLRV